MVLLPAPEVLARYEDVLFKLFFIIFIFRLTMFSDLTFSIYETYFAHEIPEVDLSRTLR